MGEERCLLTLVPFNVLLRLYHLAPGYPRGLRHRGEHWGSPETVNCCS